MTLPTPPTLREIQPHEVTPELLKAETPWVVRGVASDWPLLADGTAPEQVIRQLQRFYQGRPVKAFLGEPKDKGRFTYNEDLSALNFVSVDTRLDQVLAKLLQLAGASEPPTVYVGATHVDTWLPGFRQENQIEVIPDDARVSLWIGNHSCIAAHFDFPRNLAVCVMGQRRFTVFPPDQVKNLYIGPWDLTPAGQPISLVDFAEPDLERFPKFADAWGTAQIADLAPGDAIYMPGMWWHHVEGLAPVNGLVNYWWTETDAVFGAPTDAFNHALLSIRSMPKAQREAWRTLFEHYVFSDRDDGHLDHIPPKQRGRLDDLDQHQATALCQEIIQSLKR